MFENIHSFKEKIKWLFSMKTLLPGDLFLEKNNTCKLTLQLNQALHWFVQKLSK